MEYLEELKDGKLPPVIWLASGKWYPDSTHDPEAIRHIEVTSARNCSIKFKTPSAGGGEPYEQFFLKMPEKPACRWCGGDDHAASHCPRVKAFNFAPDGTWTDDGHPNVFISRVEFLTPRDCVVMREKEPEPEGEYPRRGPMGAGR